LSAGLLNRIRQHPPDPPAGTICPVHSATNLMRETRHKRCKIPKQTKGQCSVLLNWVAEGREPSGSADELNNDMTRLRHW